MTVYTSFFDQADTLVVESLEGLTMLNPELVFNKSIKCKYLPRWSGSFES